MGQPQSKSYKKAFNEYGKEHCEDLFADRPTLMLSCENYDRLSKSKQLVINEILPAVKNGEGFGFGASPKTIETWELIRAKLTFLALQWVRNIGFQTPEALAIPSKDDVAPFIDLEWALARECSGLSVSDHQNKSSRKNSQEGRKFLSQHQVEYGAPELVAYNALCALHKHAEKRGWTTDEGFEGLPTGSTPRTHSGTTELEDLRGGG